MPSLARFAEVCIIKVIYNQELIYPLTVFLRIVPTT